MRVISCLSASTQFSHARAHPTQTHDIWCHFLKNRVRCQCLQCVEGKRIRTPVLTRVPVARTREKRTTLDVALYLSNVFPLVAMSCRCRDKSLFASSRGDSFESTSPVSVLQAAVVFCGRIVRPTWRPCHTSPACA